MKAILEFDLPDDQDEYDLHTNARQYHNALFDLMNYLRAKVKYEDLPEAEYKLADKIYEDFYNILNNNEVTL